MNATDQVEFLDTAGPGALTQWMSASERGEIWFTFMGEIRGWPAGANRARVFPDMVSMLHFISRDVNAQGEITFSLLSLSKALRRKTTPPVARSVGLAQTHRFLSQIRVNGKFHAFPRHDQDVVYRLTDWDFLPRMVKQLLEHPELFKAFAYDREAYLRQAFEVMREEAEALS